MERYRIAQRTIPRTFSAILLAISCGVSFAADYELKDLQALEATGDWSELLVHAKDIKPSERDDTWRALVLDAAVSSLAERSTSDAISAYDFIVTTDTEHAWLAESAVWRDQRAASGLSAAKSCMDEGYYIDGCLDAIETLASGDANNASFSFEAAALVRNHAGVQRALPLLTGAFESATEQQKATNCMSEDTALIAIGGLDSMDEASAAQAATIVFNRCPENLMPAAFEAFLSGDKNIAKNTCPMWREQKRLSGFQQAHCSDMEIN